MTGVKLKSAGKFGNGNCAKVAHAKSNFRSSTACRLVARKFLPNNAPLSVSSASNKDLNIAKCKPNSQPELIFRNNYTVSFNCSEAFQVKDFPKVKSRETCIGIEKIAFVSDSKSKMPILKSTPKRRSQSSQYLDTDLEDKSKDFIDDATMEHVRHNLFQLSSIDSMVAGGPPSAITFHSTVIGRRVNESGKVSVLLHWDPEDMVPDTWIAEGEILYNLEKTIPVSKLPPEALELPSLKALGTAGILPRPGKRKRK